MCALRFSTDTPRGRGRRGRRSRPKPSAAVSRLSKLAEKLPRSVFRLRRASPPKLGHCPCGARRADGPRWWKIALSCGWDDTAHDQPLSRRELRLARPTLRFGYSRAKVDLRGRYGDDRSGRENRSPRRRDFRDTTTDDDRTRGGAVGCLRRGGSIGPLGSLVSIGSVSIGKRR